MEQVKEWYDRQSWMSLTFYSTSAASLVLSAGAYALRRRNTRAMYEKVRPLFVDFSSPINFNPTRGVTLSSIGQAEKISYYDIHRSIRFAATDDKIPGIVVRIGRSMTMSWAQMSEFRSSLQQFKEQAPEKEIVCFCESFDHIGTLFLSSLGDRVVMQPAGIVNLQGIAGGSLFFSNALERAGVKAQVEKRHEYKNALDFLTNEKYGDAQREVTENLINGINEHVRKTIAKERGLDESTLDQLQSQGTVSSFEAMKLGLIDETAYLQDYVLESSGSLGATEQYLEEQKLKDNEETSSDQVREDAALESSFGKILSNELEHSSSSLSSRKVPKYPPRQKGSMMSVKTRPVWDVKNYLKKFDVYLKSEEKLKKGGYVAIIHAEGQISSGKKANSNGIYSETLCSVLEKALNDKKVKAVVLRIDSPGGDPVACDMITRSVQRLQAAGKPVVAQMSSVAASGGMWIASQCTRITCSPLTLTGSIGVIAGSVSFGEMLRRYGITKDSYTTHESSTPAMPWYDGLNDSQLDILSRTIDKMYDHFVKRVSVSRDLEESNVHKVAKGRVWLGSEAQIHSLVDEASESTNSPLSAVRLAAELLEDDSVSVGVVYPPPPKTFMEALAVAASKRKLGHVPFAMQSSSNMVSVPDLETPLQRLAMTGGRGTSVADFQQLKLVSDVDTVEIDITKRLRHFLSKFIPFNGDDFNK